MAKNRQFQNIAEYLIFRFFATILRLIPRMAALRLGEALGQLAMYLIPARTKLAMNNIQQSFPEMNKADCKDLCSRSFKHLGISVAEMIRIDMFNESDLDKYFTFDGLENLKKARDMNRGVLLATAHVGFWEVGTFFLPVLGFPCAFVAKKTKNPYINNYVVKMREHSGGQVIDAKKGARQIVKTLTEGNCVGVLIDHHIRKSEAVQVPFFGRPAWTTPIITQIAMKRDIPVVPIFIYRTKDFKYKAELAEPIFLDGEMTDENVTANTALLTNIIESAIRKEPSQWFWVHTRWKK
jgi:KDO2-lipid IV(A) lauroyltransferase